MITYNELYEILRKERYSEQLQVLPKNFVEQVAEYFKEKKKFSNKEGDLFSDIAVKSKMKLENAIAIFKELLLRRRKKILNLAFVASETGISKKDFENLLDFEKKLFDGTIKSLEETDKNLNSIMNGAKQESRYKLARFLEDVEEFLGIEGEPIGPFEKAEVVNLEKEIVDILEKNGKVEVIGED